MWRNEAQDSREWCKLLHQDREHEAPYKIGAGQKFVVQGSQNVANKSLLKSLS